jgi:hypothetical protein
MGIFARLQAALSNIWENADIFVVFVTALTLGVLDILNVVDNDRANAAILPVLAALAFVWFRDRSRNSRIVQQISGVEATTEALRGLLTDGQPMRTLTGQEIPRELMEARSDTDQWLFKGSTGGFTRAVTLPECVERARLHRSPLRFAIEILDPTDVPLCDRYSRLHHELAGPDAEEQTWTAHGTRKDVYATILAACWYQQRSLELLEMTLSLSSAITLFRWDLSSSRLVLTYRGPQFPAVSFPRQSPHYRMWRIELRASMRQARQVPIERATPLSEWPTPEETRALFASLGIALSDDFTEADIGDIVRTALARDNPYYGQPSPPRRK